MMWLRVWLNVGVLLFLLGSATAVQPSTPSLLITEIYYDTPGADETEEWIEIGNVGDEPVSLAGVKLGDEETLGQREGMLRLPDEAVLQPGEAIIVAQTAVGFRARFGQNPTYEIQESDTAVPDLRPYRRWALGDVALANGGDELLLLDGDNQIIDAVSYEESRVYLQPSVAGVFSGQSIERVPADCDTDSAADWQPQPQPTPGRLIFEGECTTPEAAAAAYPPIGAIQGETAVSPLVNQIVTFEGVVTGVYEDRNARGIVYYTLFVQDLPERADGNPATSDGMAIFLGRERPSFQPGDHVRVSGQVTEFFGFTEISDEDVSVTAVASGLPLPDPIPLTLPPGADAAAAFEAWEGMRVALPNPARVVGPTYGGCGFSVVDDAAGPARIWARAAAPPLGQSLPILHHTDVNCDGFPQVKTGDVVTGLAGPLIYHFEAFKLVQQAPGDLAVTTAVTPTLPALPALTADQFSVVTFNLENHFDAVDDTGNDAEPKPSPAEIAHKQAKLARALSEVLGCPTLVGIQEVEKASLLLDLAEAAAAGCGFTYTVTHRESADGRGIDVALLSDPRRVTVRAAALRQGCTPIATGIADAAANCPAGESPLFSRPPLSATVTIDGQTHTVLVNHFKSKRGGEAETTPRRLAQAAHVAGLAADLQAADPAARVLVMGDFNDFEASAPLRLLAQDGRLTNVLLQASDETRYSYVFGGASQLIDGILASPALAEGVTAVAIRHTNADFPAGLAASDSIYRFTDHDVP